MGDPLRPQSTNLQAFEKELSVTWGQLLKVEEEVADHLGSFVQGTTQKKHTESTETGFSSKYTYPLFMIWHAQYRPWKNVCQ
jgi:hypothetical protein